jgi:hypothetical protein
MRLMTALIPLVFAAAIASPAFAAGSMQMTGHGEVTAAPDTADVSSGVTTQATTARDALDANTAAMTQLVATLKAAGVDAKDIQTSNFSVSPVYVYPSQQDSNGQQQPPKIVGYSVSNQVTVHVRDLKALGSILDQSVSVGANTIGGIAFSVDDPSALFAEARKAAFADAKAKADLYAQAAGVELGPISQINEQQGNSSPIQPVAFKVAALAADRAPVPVEAGQLTYSIDVNVNWDLAPAH